MDNNIVSTSEQKLVKIGRPSSFTQETADTICLRLAEGKSLRKICDDENMPGMSSVMRWLDDEKNAGFREQYARARAKQADYYAEQTVDISDESPVYMGETAEGEKTPNVRVDSGWTAQQRLRVDARKWYASKLVPKKYGDKIDHEHSGTMTVQITSADGKVL